MKKILFLLYAFIWISLSDFATAAWLEPVEVASGSWGSAPGEFMRKETDSGMFHPMGFCVTGSGYVAVGDNLNFRIQVFSPKGTLFSTFGPKNIPKTELDADWPTDLECANNNVIVEHGELVQVYKLNGARIKQWTNIDGKIRLILSDGSFIAGYDKTYKKYSASGQLIKSYSEYPSELGIVISKERVGDSQLNTTIKYNDVTYSVLTPSEILEFYRDNMGYLNVYYKYQTEAEHGRVSKFDIYGNLIASMDKPDGESDEDEPDNEYRMVSYSGPVFSPNGDVYFDRLGGEYTVLKWAWQPEPPRQAPPKVLAVPKRFDVYSGTGGIVVDWLSKSEDASCIIGHEIYRAEKPEGPFDLLTRIENNAVRYRDPATEVGKTYYYKIRAFCGAMYSHFTKVLGDTRE